MMLCQECKKRNATTHYKQIINGEVTEYHLCHECAEKKGCSNLFADFSKSFDNVLGSFFSVPSVITQSVAAVPRCSGCGSSFDDIVRAGRAGCAECYTTFESRIMPSIARIHGNTAHVGKKIKASDKKKSREKKIAELKNDLAKAVEAQEFEKAAELRDRIRALEKEGEK